jgi:diguanylate cyclase (GGDEF)-like protein
MSETLSWGGYQISSCSKIEEAQNILTSRSFDLVLLDVKLQESKSGFDLLNLAKNCSDSYVSVIFVSGESNTETVVNGLDLGADDYIIKPFSPAEFLARVRAQLRIKDLTDNLRKANLKLQELVEIDDLTGLFNMRSIYQKLDLEIQRSKRYQRQVCVVMMDMDYFKSVNDGHDHLFGSFVLSEVGKLIQKTVRNIDIPARYGGDEFLIVLTETHHDGAMAFCERLRTMICNYHFKNGSDEIRLTASLGFAIASPSEYDLDAQALVREADRALYESKRSGRNRTSSRQLGPKKLRSVG